MRRSKLREQIRAKFEKKSRKNRDKILGITQKDKKIARDLKAARPSVEDYIESMSDVPKIGLGLESDIKIRRIKIDEVVLDKHTKSCDKEPQYHALYPAGWSLKKCNEE